MTEEQAKSKFCPFKSIAISMPEIEVIDKSSKWDCCIASRCMMWVWEKSIEFSPSGRVVDGTDTKSGYCGLGGK